MTHRRPAASAAAALVRHPSREDRWSGSMWGALGLCTAIAALAAGMVRAQDEVTVTHAYANFGEPVYGPDFEHLAYVNPDAPKGGEISTWAQGTFDSFNPYAFAGVSASLATIGSEAVLTSTADDPYALYCFMCTTMEYPEDISYVTFNLRDDVTFSDGTPVTSQDVRYSTELFLEQGIPEFRLVRSAWIESIETPDDHTITFRFTDEAPLRDRISFAGGTPILNQAWFEANEYRLDEPTEAPLMSTGAYVLESFDYNRDVVYRYNPEYWARDLNWNVGRNNFETIRVEYFADASAGFEAFKAGEYSFRTENTSLIWATGYDFPAIDRGWVVTDTIPDGNVGTRQSFVFQLDKAKWQDIRVRQAVEQMFNFEWTNETLFYGLYARPTSFWVNTDLAAVGTPTEGELAILEPLVAEGLLDESILTGEAVMPATADAAENRVPRGNLRRAAGLLEEAGWAVGDSGFFEKDGEVLELVILQFSPQFDRIVNPYIENLRLLGIDARLERVDLSTYQERRLSGDFDMTNAGFSMTLEPGQVLFQWFGSDTAGESSRNIQRLRNEAVDRIIPQVVAADTLEALESATRSLDRVLRSLHFEVPQWFNDQHWVAYYDMYRHPEEIPPYALGQFDFWWYDAERAEELRAAGAFRR